MSTRAILARPGSLSWPVRALVISEVLIAYARTVRKLDGRDLRDLVANEVRSLTLCAGQPQLTESEAHRIAMKLGWVVSRTLTFLPTDSRCLAQSLVLLHLLSVRNVEGRLVIGAATATGEGFAAHAWVEHAGRPVLPERGFGESRLVEL